MLYLLAAEGGAAINPLHHADPANWKAGLWALGIFIVLVFVLKKLAWGPIVAGLNAREERIAQSLNKAEEIEKATAALAETNRQMLEDAQKEAQSIIAASRETAANTADEIVAKADEEIAAQRDRAQRELQLETEKAKAELRAHAVDLTIDAAGRLIGRTLTGEDQRRLAAEALADAEKVARN